MVTQSQVWERRWVQPMAVEPPASAELMGCNANGQEIFCIAHKGGLVSLFIKCADGNLDTWDGMPAQRPIRFIVVPS